MEISSSSDYNNAAYRRAEAAEKDANERVAEATKRVEQAQHDAAQRIDEIKDEYVARESAEVTRDEGSIQAEKARGYERIRDLQRQNQTQLNRSKRDGDRETQKLQDYYKATTSTLERDGSEKVRNIEAQKTEEYNYAQKNGEMALADLRNEHAHQIERLKEHQDEQAAAIDASDRAQYQQLVERSEDASRQSEQHFQNRFQTQVKGENDTLEHLYGLANQKILEVRQDTSQKLAAYNERQKDPFYKMMDTKAQFTDQGEYYELRAKVPEYEQEHVSALIRGNELVLQGTRADNERIDLAPGRMKNSSAYQTFQETFPLAWPVDGRRMTREFVGDVMIVRVPKNNPYAFHPQHEPRKPDKLRAERPHFPDNIPHTKMDPAEEKRQQAQKDKDPTSKPTPGRGL